MNRSVGMIFFSSSSSKALLFLLDMLETLDRRQDHAKQVHATSLSEAILLRTSAGNAVNGM